MNRWPAAVRIELDEPMRRLDTRRAACRIEVEAYTADPDWWFADPSEDILRRHAINICGDCPIREACGEAAIDARIPYGIFGGMTPKQRTALVRERARRAA